MTTEYATRRENDSTSETHLWQAVIVTTIQEWRSGQLRRSREAEQYLFNDNTGFLVVCQLAGMDHDRLRAGLARLRPRSHKAEDSPKAA
jgi:hypothetical protein